MTVGRCGAAVQRGPSRETGRKGKISGFYAALISPWDMRGGAAFSRSMAKFVSVNAEFGLE